MAQNLLRRMCDHACERLALILDQVKETTP